MERMQIQYDRQSDSLVACTDSGRCLVALQLTPIRKAVLKYLNYRTGWGWSDIKKAAGKITKAVGAKKLLEKVKEVAKSDIVKQGLGIASQIYPPLGLSYAAVSKTAHLLNDAQNGKPEAHAKVAKLMTLAKTDPKARRVVSAMRAMRVAEKKGKIDSAPAWAQELIQEVRSSIRGGGKGLFSNYWAGIR